MTSIVIWKQGESIFKFNSVGVEKNQKEVERIVCWN
jgi:hypothetical protein